MSYYLNLNVEDSYTPGRYVFRTDDGLDWNLIFEEASGPSQLTQGYYGSFYDLTIQYPVASNTPATIKIGNTLEANGIRIVDGDKIYFDQNGTYTIIYSIQFSNRGASTEDIQVWLSKNGVYEESSNSFFSVPAKHAGTNGHTIGTVNYMMTMQTGDYHQLIWSASHTDVFIDTIPDGDVPDSPGIILSIQQISNVQQATTQISESLSFNATVEGTTVLKTAGENLVFGDIVYFKSDGKAWKADATVAGTYPAIAMASAPISADAVGLFLLIGTVRYDTWNWNIGEILYLSTNGQMTQSPPSSTDNAIQVLGVAHPNADTIFFRPSFDYITHT